MNARTGAYLSRREGPCFLAMGLCLTLCLVFPTNAQQSSPATSQSSSQTQQSSAAAPEASDSSNAPEMNTRDTTIPLQSRVNVVPLRIVVRDAKGSAIENLRKEDFQVFEDGKLQDISHFSIETPASAAQTIVRDDAVATPGGAPAAPGFVPPSRFVALLFDDVHVATADLMRTRQAATRFVNTALQPTDRVSVYTISGQSQMDFTADRDKLEKSLNGLMVRPVGAHATDASDPNQCPPMDYYEANQIQNNLDPTALTVATQDTLACAFQNNPQFMAQAQMLAQSSATQAYEEGSLETDFSLRRLEEALRRLSGLPGQRILVLLSPGFIYPEREYQLSQLIDKANRANIFINTLDARGLYTPDMDDAGNSSPGNPNVSGQRGLLRAAAQSAGSDVLAVLADGTGGMHFHNSNDLTGGLQMIAGAPAVSYLIAFTPRNFKYDGKFHSLKVKIPSVKHVVIETRRGFYAPKHSLSVDEATKEEIEEAVFSQDVESALPIGVHTQYYKVDASNAKLAVMAHIDLAHLRFQKAAGRNDDNVTVVTALFDRDGNIVSGIEKTVEMRLRDTTFERLSRTGVTLKTSFDVKPGDYLVRLVVRDSNAAQLSTENDAVEIPY
ncbi:MAG TPA: VWA domain-containing protein [Candidatus Acidoferrales bacterium]|nr:VWA domain-containing protein [Candidatus Acidoferrales bacterium]